MKLSLFSVVALFIQDGKILAISRKTNHEDLGLPGGKIDSTDKTPEDALKREVDEEVGVLVQEMEPIFEDLDRVEGSERRPCRCYRVTKWEGEPVSREGAWVGWVAMSRLLETSCSFHEYNRALFRTLGFLFD